MEQIRGLTTEEAEKRLKEVGPNRIFEPEKFSFFSIAKHEITEPMILLLFVVGIFYSIWGKLGDAITIFVVIFLLVFAEVFNEFRAKKAISSLEKITAPKTKVLRDGNVAEVYSEEVVPGDVLILTTGTKIAADAKVQKSIGLQVDESALTGESFPVEKNENDEIYAGCTVVSGEGEAVVVSTGKATKLGQIAANLKEVKAPADCLAIGNEVFGRKIGLPCSVFLHTHSCHRYHTGKRPKNNDFNRAFTCLRNHS